MTIYLIRHGQDFDNAQGVVNGHHDDELTNLGKLQSEEAAKKLVDKNIKAIYTSPLKRCLETASIIAQELKIHPIQIRDDLTDRDFGKLTGLSVNYIHERREELTKDSGVEKAQSVYDRVKRVFLEIKSLYPNDHVAVISHGDPCQMFQAIHANLNVEQGFKLSGFANGEIVELKA